jgi:hypothetical protein
MPNSWIRSCFYTRRKGHVPDQAWFIRPLPPTFFSTSNLQAFICVFIIFCHQMYTKRVITFFSRSFSKSNRRVFCLISRVFPDVSCKSRRNWSSQGHQPIILFFIVYLLLFSIRFSFVLQVPNWTWFWIE